MFALHAITWKFCNLRHWKVGLYARSAWAWPGPVSSGWEEGEEEVQHYLKMFVLFQLFSWQLRLHACLPFWLADFFLQVFFSDFSKDLCGKAAASLSVLAHVSIICVIFAFFQFFSCAAGMRVRRVGACVSGSRHCIIKTYVLVATTNVGQATSKPS